jgi:hypothetical protein
VRFGSDDALFAEHDAFDAVGAAGGSIAGDEGSAHLWVALGGLELAGHAGEEAREDELLFYTDHRIVGAGHAHVCLVGGAVWEDALVGCGDVGVSAKQSGDAAVEIPAESHFFAGGFAVKIEQDDLCGDFAEEFVGFAEGVVAGGHEDAALEVHDGVGLAVWEFALVDTEAGCADSVVGRANHTAAADVRIDGDGHVLEDLFFVPDVVARGDDVGAQIEEFFCNGRGDAKAPGGVFAVDNEEIDGVGVEDVGQVFAYDVAAGGAKDVADEEDIHCEILHGCGGAG